MITLSLIIGGILFLGVCYAVNESYKSRFGNGILMTSSAVAVYIAAGLYVIAAFGLGDKPGELVDIWYNVFVFNTDDWISGFAYFGLILFAVGWNMNVKDSTLNWGTFATIIQAIVGAATFVIILLILAAFFGSKKSAHYFPASRHC